MTHVYISVICIHWFRSWLGTCLVPNSYLNLYQIIVNWILQMVKMCLKMAYAKYWPLCTSLNGLNHHISFHEISVASLNHVCQVNKNICRRVCTREYLKTCIMYIFVLLIMIVDGFHLLCYICYFMIIESTLNCYEKFLFCCIPVNGMINMSFFF